MAGYYYLIAQLPALSPNQGAPMSSDELRELAKALMSEADAAPLSRCDLDPFVASADLEAITSSGSDFVDSWLAWERSLRFSLAKARAQRLKRDAGPYETTEAEPPDVGNAVKSALAADSPLDAELLLDKARWAAIEALGESDYFSRDTVYAYSLKLQLLERRARFHAEDGFVAYKAIYEGVLSNAPTHIAPGV